jgi:hypothetical protein
MEASGQQCARDASPLGMNSGTRLIGGSVGSIADLNVLEERNITCPYRDSNLGLCSPQTCHYTDYIIVCLF